MRLHLPTFTLFQAFLNDIMNEMRRNANEHVVGIIGGAIWCLATALVYLCGNKAGYAVSYALGQCAAMVALIWGVFVWKEFKGAPKGTGKLILFVFITYVVGITFMILASN